MNSPLLVLTNQVYARKKDGLFYPGSVESKNNDGYAVRFMDDTKERVMEANMTWMGFWDLPPWCWPKNPLVNISASIGKPSDKRVDFSQGYQDFKQQRPDSLTVVGNNDKEGWMAQKNSEQTQLLSKTRCPCTQQRLFVDRQGAAAQRKMEDKKQPSSSSLNRSSVLRLNKKALARDLSRSLNAEASFYPPKIVKQPKNTAVLSPLLRSVPTPELVRTAERPHINNRQFTTAKVDKISSDEADHEAFEYKCRPKRHEIWRSEKVEEECDEKMAKYHDWNGRQSPYSLDHPQKLQTFDWHNASHFDHVLLTPPMTPSNLAHAPSELELPAFGHGTRPTRFIGRDWEQLDTIPSAPISSKGRKRGGMKKCRKVYGAVNRHLWCTQCRWKKACRRFSSFTMETHFKPYLD